MSVSLYIALVAINSSILVAHTYLGKPAAANDGTLSMSYQLQSTSLCCTWRSIKFNLAILSNLILAPGQTTPERLALNNSAQQKKSICITTSID